MWKDGDISNKPLIVAGGGGGQGVLGHKISGYGGDGWYAKVWMLYQKHKDIPDPINIVDNFGKDGEGGGDLLIQLKNQGLEEYT